MDEKTYDCRTWPEDLAVSLQEVFASADKVYESELNTLDLHEFIATQIANCECHFAEAIVRHPKTMFSYDADGTSHGVTGKLSFATVRTHYLKASCTGYPSLLFYGGAT